MTIDLDQAVAFLLDLDREDQTDDHLKSQADKSPDFPTAYIGSKKRLVDWIWKNTPTGISSVIDGFAGSCAVAYMYKRQGLRVVTNDILGFSHHIARAIIVNQKTILDDSDIDHLLKPTSSAPTFIADTFKGLFFDKPVLEYLGRIRHNIDDLKGYKKDLALFALGKTATTSARLHGHFVSSNLSPLRDSLDQFLERFRKTIAKINALVFDNGQKNQAIRGKAVDALKASDADLAYFDPPYVTETSVHKYEYDMHFIEGLMVYWQGLDIDPQSKVKALFPKHTWPTKKTIESFLTEAFRAADHIPHWLVSHSENGRPKSEVMRKLIKNQGRWVAMRGHHLRYNFGNKLKTDQKARELLFVAGRDATQKAKANTTNAAPLKASLPITLKAQAMTQEPEADPRFDFVLCHVGTNRNGDHFTRAELQRAASSAANTKVNLKHSQEITHIVGGVRSAQFDDGDGGRVLCTGELYTDATPHAVLAHKLIQKGIISQVSMECDYIRGECSVCHKCATHKGDQCIHLKRYKGQTYQGQAVFEILHGVTFTGLGLLDREGADEAAKITSFANHQPNGGPMEHPKDSKKPPNTQPPTEPKDLNDQNTRLKEENSRLKDQVLELQKKVQNLEAQQKAMANQKRAEALVAQALDLGITFADDAARLAEIDRLKELNDDAFEAVKATYASMQALKPPKPKAQTQPQAALAAFRPKAIDDPQIEDEALVSGLMADYEARMQRGE